MELKPNYYDHKPHFKGKIGENRVSCGGTEPPTSVTEDQSGHLRVDIFPRDSNVHVGEVLVADSSQEYSIQINLSHRIFSLNAIGQFARRAIADSMQA